MVEPRTHVEDDTAPTRLSAPEARQGRLGRPVLLVLVVSLVIAVIATLTLLGWQRSTIPNQPGQVENSTVQQRPDVPQTPPQQPVPRTDDRPVPQR